MKKNLVLEFYKSLINDNQCLLYNGNFSDKITYKIIELIEANIKHQHESLKTQKRVSYLMAECFQNIIRHGEGSENKEMDHNDANFFMTRNYLNKYYILSGNLIKNSNIQNVKNQIDQINGLNDEELKKLHKDVLRFGSVSAKGGAGLGLIDMARKSGYKIGYHFENYSELISLFYNQIVLKSDNSDELENEEMMGIDAAMTLHKKLVKENILMIQKGDFSQESILPVLNIIERSIIDSDNKSQNMKNLYKAMVELLQNISNHAFSHNEFREGIFMLTQINNSYGISTGNYINNDEIETLTEHLNSINTMNNSQLDDWYSEKLLSDLDDENGQEYGLGLIDLAMVLNEKFTFNFETIDEEKSFFTISIQIH